MYKYIAGGLLIVAIFVVAGAVMTHQSNTPSTVTIRYGISPYQDTAIPVLSESLGLFERERLDVELVNIAWNDIAPVLASAGETVDIAIGSMNDLIPRAENINVKGGGDVIFYAPLYIFKGIGFVSREDSGIKPLSEFLQKYPDDRDRAIREAMAQLKGKQIGLPQGTADEQMLYSALKTAGMTTDDIDLRHVKFADALPAFLSGHLDVIATGVTQRTEATRHGHKLFMDGGQFGFVNVDGIMTTERFAKEHPEELQKIIDIWFETANTLLDDTDTNARPIIEYLDHTASTHYTIAEYKNAIALQEFPRSREEAAALINDPDGKYYWKRIWDIMDDYLVATDQVNQKTPYTYYWGEMALQGN